MNRLEYEALEDEYLCHEARTLYVLCLRRHMDFSTGLVGTQKRRVSYQQFREYLSVSRPRRSTVPPFIPSTQQLRGYVQELVRVGLVVRMPKRSKTDYMVFRLPLATTDNQQSDFFRPNEEQHLSNKDHQQKQQQVEQQTQAQQKQPVNPCQQQAGQQAEQHLSNIEEQHTSVTSDINSHTYAHEPELSLDEFDQRFGVEFASEYASEPVPQNQPRKFAMYSSWRPDHTFIDQAVTLGLDLNNLSSEQGEKVEQALEEFRTWWMESRPGTQETQRLWQQKFIQTSLKRELNNNKGTHHGNGHQQNHTSHSGSAVTRPYTEQDFDLDATW